MLSPHLKIRNSSWILVQVSASTFVRMLATKWSYCSNLQNFIIGPWYQDTKGSDPHSCPTFTQFNSHSHAVRYSMFCWKCTSVVSISGMSNMPSYLILQCARLPQQNNNQWQQNKMQQMRRCCFFSDQIETEDSICAYHLFRVSCRWEQCKSTCRQSRLKSTLQRLGQILKAHSNMGSTPCYYLCLLSRTLNGWVRLFSLTLADTIIL